MVSNISIKLLGVIVCVKKKKRKKKKEDKSKVHI